MIRRILYAFVTTLVLGLPVAAQNLPGQARLDELFAALGRADVGEWQVIEDEIWQLWSESGSPSIDLLLERGMAALAADEVEAAIEHFTALIDHAPDFAEGWNGRATAYFVAGLYGPSLADIRQTLALEPRHFGALSGLGLILEDLGETARALQALRNVAKIHPHHPDIGEAIKRLQRSLGSQDI